MHRLKNFPFHFVMLLFLVMGKGFSAEALLADSTNHWGYGYDSLLKDIQIWKKSPFVKVDSLGASVQGRALWMISISDTSDSLSSQARPSAKKHRVFIHARTHPSEVQANEIANEAIRFLLDTNIISAKLRAEYIFNIIPMYNPDGVENGIARKNANQVDLESNWNQVVLEPEVICLKKTFTNFMASSIPIEVALNLHSDQLNCTRFFFFHFAAGTSVAYTNLEKKFIADVQSHFVGGIQNYDFVQSWEAGTKTQYPEGFWWTNYQEKVLALTYEDTNCPGAGKFDTTAQALVLGSTDFILSRSLNSIKPVFVRDAQLLPTREGIRVFVKSDFSQTYWMLIDSQGRQMARSSLNSKETLLPWSIFAKSRGGILVLAGPSGIVARLGT